MNDIEFYEACADLLGTQYKCKSFPWHKRTRWNNRAAGSGRYPGFGLIRVYGDQVHVSLRHPVSHFEVYDSKEKVLAFLRTL